MSTDSNHHDEQSPCQDSGDEQPSLDTMSEDSFDGRLSSCGSDRDIVDLALDGLQHSKNQASSAPVKYFQYKPLDLKGCHFRLLRLLRGDELRLECELFHSQMNVADMMPYEALSYTWGSLVTSHNINVNGQNLPITTNLYSALRNLQREDEDRILWVDAICIDQSNDEERYHQVNQMGRIFSEAERVIFWLGDPSYTSDVVMSTLRRLEQCAQTKATGKWHPSDERWQILWAQVQPASETESVNASFSNDLIRLQSEGLRYLLKKSWFRRVWIIQEVAHAKKAVVCCGNKSVSSRTFVLAPTLVGLQPDSRCQSILDIMPGPLRQNSWWEESCDLYTIVRRFGPRSEASDPRDMVYALLGVAQTQQSRHSLLPDYTKSEAQVVAAATLEMFGLDDPPYFTMSDLIQNIGFLNTRALLRRATSDQPIDLTAFFIQRSEQIELSDVGTNELARVVKEGSILIDEKLHFKIPFDCVSTGYSSQITKILVRIAVENTKNGVAILEFLLAYPVRGALSDAIAELISYHFPKDEVLDTFLGHHEVLNTF